MNKYLRKQIHNIINEMILILSSEQSYSREAIKELLEQLRGCLEGEEAVLNNVPESLQESERYQNYRESYENMQDLYNEAAELFKSLDENIDEFIECIGEITQEL